MINRLKGSIISVVEEAMATSPADKLWRTNKYQWKKRGRYFLAALLFVALLLLVVFGLLRSEAQSLSKCVTFRKNMFEGYLPEIAIDGNSAVITDFDAGSVHFYTLEKNNWERSQEISIGIASWRSVDISGNVAVVGDPYENFFKGVVHVFERDSASGSWARLLSILPNDLDEWFGVLVNIVGDVILITSFCQYNAIYGVYRRSEDKWPLELRLDFPIYVTLSSQQYIIAAQRDQPTLSLYRYDSFDKLWYQSQEIDFHEKCADFVMPMLALTQDWGLLIGCEQENKNTSALFYYTPSDEGDSFIFQQKVMDFDFGFFGENRFEMDGNVIAVSTDQKTYIFILIDNTWKEVAKVVSPIENSFFWTSAALSGDQLLISNGINVSSHLFERCRSASSQTIEESPATTKPVPSAISGPLPASTGCATFVTSLNMSQVEVIIEGDLAVVTDRDSIYFYTVKKNTWEIAQKFYIGKSYEMTVAISGNTAVVGDPYYNSTGTVHIFKRDSPNGRWTQLLDVLSDDTGNSQSFGLSVDIDGDVIVVAAEDPESEFYYAFIYHRRGDTWTQITRFDFESSSDGNCEASVAIKGDIIAMSTCFLGDEGFLYIYKYDSFQNSWFQSQERIASYYCQTYSGKHAQFSKSGGMFLGFSPEALDTGAVYYYTQSGKNNSFVLHQKIMTSERAPEKSFGDEVWVATDGNVMAARGSDMIYYIFTLTNGSWKQKDKIHSSYWSQHAGDGVLKALSESQYVVSEGDNTNVYSLQTCLNEF